MLRPELPFGGSSMAGAWMLSSRIRRVNDNSVQSSHNEHRIHADSRTTAIVRQNAGGVLYIEVRTDEAIFKNDGAKNSVDVVCFRPPISFGLQPHRPGFLSEQL